MSGWSETTRVLLALSAMLFAGFCMTRVTKKLRLPNVSGYITAGILIGPSVLNWIPGDLILHMEFLSDTALAFIAFGVGQFFRREAVRSVGKKILVITLAESILAGAAVTGVLVLVFRMRWDLALILGAIATATAPASTMMTIQQYKASGVFVNILLQVVALDDAVCLLVFSIVTGAVEAMGGGTVSGADVLLPIAWNLAALILGFGCGVGLSRLMTDRRTRANRLILAVAMLLGLSGLCSVVEISPLLACMVVGMTYVNCKKDQRLFQQVDHFAAPIMSLFFVLSGMNLDLKVLQSVGIVGAAYFVIRIIGKYLGAYVGCLAVKTEPRVRNYLGLALIPQAGVSIGLSVLTGRMMPGEGAELVSAVILSSAVLYELLGPASAKLALHLAGSIPAGGTESGEAGPGDA